MTFSGRVPSTSTRKPTCSPAVTRDLAASSPGWIASSFVFVGGATSARKAHQGRVVDRLRIEHRVDAEDDDDRRQDVGRLEDAPLVDDPLDVDLRQLADGLRLDRRHERLGQVLTVLLEGQVVDQAVLEFGLGRLDGLGRVHPVDAGDDRPDDPQGRERGRGGQTHAEDDPPDPGRQGERMVEHDLEEEHAERGG